MWFQNKTKQPKWSHPLTAEQYEVFKTLLFDRSNGKFDVATADKHGVLHVDDAEFNMYNLVHLCANLPEADWQNEIDNYVNGFAMINEGPDYERDKKDVVLQLYPHGYFGELDSGSMPVIREDIPGVHTALVIDSPFALASVTDDSTGPWMQHKDELFAAALQKLADAPPYDVGFVTLSEGSRAVAVIESEDITTATHALMLGEKYPQLIGKNGALVSLPTRNLIMVYALDAPHTDQELSMVLGASQYLAGQNPYVLSPQVYAYLENTFTDLTGSET